MTSGNEVTKTAVVCVAGAAIGACVGGIISLTFDITPVCAYVSSLLGVVIGYGYLVGFCS